MPNNSPFVASVNDLLAKLEDNPTVDTGIELANQIVSLFGDVHTKSVEDVFESSIELPNAERYDSWFQPHPIFKSDRACFDLADSPLLQAKFYWLKKRSRQIIAGGVHFTPNYEDEEFTHNERYKVGLDFFLSPNGKSLQVVLSNRGNLRIVELSGRLNNTQKEIFEKWIGAGSLKSQEALHTTLWESFKLKSVNQKFYDGVSKSFTELLQHLKSIDKDEEEAKLFASRLLGRLLFCWFLRKKGIIDESVGYFNAHDSDATNYYKQSLERLFFLTLNTPIDERDELTKRHQKALFPDLLAEDQPSLFKTDQKTPYLNGGLFEPHENDWYKDDSLTLPEGFFTNLYEHFEEFNFTTDESSPEYEQIAIDPEMLGRVFESLLATQVDETGQQARKAKGAFYTPREIVSYMCKESLRNYLYNAVNNDESIKESIDSLLDISDSEWAKSKSNTLRDKVKDNRTQIIDALDAVTILDPACGSGAFPMGMLQLILKTYERLESRFDPYIRKLSIIKNNIFGVDIEPMAVEISRLRAWLSLIVDEDDPRSVDPLPNLDFKFVCANSLVPLDNEVGLFSDSSLHQKLKDIRTKYFNARKKHTKKALQDEYYKLTSSEQTSLITEDNRTTQLKSFDPFKNSHPANFFDIDHMFGIRSGFNILIGNPPYVQKKKGLFPDSLYIHSEKLDKGKQNLYKVFIEFSYLSLSNQGVCCLITQSSLMCDISASFTRLMLLKNTNILQIIEFPKKAKDTSSQVFDNVLQGTCIVLFLKNDDLTSENEDFSLAVGNDTNTISKLEFENISQKNLIEYFPGKHYIPLIKPGEFKIIKKIEENSKPLHNFVKEIKKGDLNLGTNSGDFSGDVTSVKLYRGKNVGRYQLKTATKEYIRDGFKQKVVEQNSNSNIIVGQNVTGTTDKYRLIFCLASNQRALWGDSVNKIVLAKEANEDYVLGLLNSKLLDWYFRKTSTNNHVNGYELEDLPIIDFDSNSLDCRNIAKSTTELCVDPENVSAATLLDRSTYNIFGISEDEIRLIEEDLK